MKRYSIHKSVDEHTCNIDAGHIGVSVREKTCVLWQCASALVIYTMLAVPAIRNMLEQYLLMHMLIQIPLLTLCGVILGNQWCKISNLTIAYHHALPLLFIALTFTMYWMLPKNLDASLFDMHIEIFKYVSIPVLIGFPLSLSWRYVGVITRGFFLVNIVSMLAVLSWLYQSAPTRLCNYYLIDEQQYLGQAIFYIIIVISAFYVFRLFVRK